MSAAAGTARPSLFRSLRVQGRVIVALMIRDVHARYGGEGLGFFWIIAEPLILTCGVILLWTLTRRVEAGHRISVVLFGLTAYSHIQLWRLSVLSSMLIVRREAWLYYHRNVTAVDLIIARTLIHSLGIFASFWIVYLAGLLFGVFDPPSSIFITIAAWGLDTFFVLSASVFIAGLSELSDIVEKLIHPLLYLTLPVTGAFSLTNWLPAKAQVFVIWSPLANVCEMFRAGLLSEAVKTVWNVPFVLIASLLLLTIGLPLVEYGRKTVAVN